jgi:hypothetical protein
MGCNNPPARDIEPIDLEQITSANLIYRFTDHQTMLFDSVSLPLPLLHRFVEAWNTAHEAGPMKFIPSFIIKVRFRDNSNRSFRLNGSHAKEKIDWSFALSDTTVRNGLDSLREINERWFGSYGTENGAVLSLSRNGRYDYSLYQCTHGWNSEGTWSTVADTLRLIADPEPKNASGPLSGRFEWASFDEPFVRKGPILYFTVGGDLNHHYFFTKECPPSPSAALRTSSPSTATTPASPVLPTAYANVPPAFRSRAQPVPRRH